MLTIKKTEFALIIALSISSMGRADALKRKLIEFKKPVTCTTAQKVLVPYDFQVSCRTPSHIKVRFFKAYYLGKRGFRALQVLVRANPWIADVSDYSEIAALIDVD